MAWLLLRRPKTKKDTKGKRDNKPFVPRGYSAPSSRRASVGQSSAHGAVLAVPALLQGGKHEHAGGEIDAIGPGTTADADGDVQDGIDLGIETDRNVGATQADLD